MSAAERFLLAARRGRPAHELDALLSHVRIEYAVLRLHVELQRLSAALAHCSDPQAHSAHDLIRAAIQILEELESAPVASKPARARPAIEVHA